MKALLIFLESILLTLLLNSCSGLSSMNSEQLKAAIAKGIIVIETETKITLDDSPVSDIKIEDINGSEFSFADYMVKKLRHRGYDASKKEWKELKSHPVSLILIPTSPYRMTIMKGGGFHQSNGEAVMAFCNYKGIIHDMQQKAVKDQRDSYKNQGRFFDETPITRSVSSWEELSHSEKNILKMELRKHMEKQSNFILSQLGFN